MIRIRGYASTERIDRDGDIIASDAFAESLRDYLNAGGVILYNHDKDKVIGKCISATIVPGKGLLVEAEIFTTDEEILAGIRAGALKSFSVGFLAKEYDPTLVEGGVVYEKGDLLEISVVSVPANPDAVFTIEDTPEPQKQAPTEAAPTAGLERLASVAIVVKDIEIKQKEETTKEEEKPMEEVRKEIETVVEGVVEGVETKTVSISELAKEVEKSIEQTKVEKAVNTLATSTQYGTTGRSFIFDGLRDGKIFYVPNVQTMMNTTTVQIPVLGEANVATGEAGVSADSDVGTNTITLTATQYTARYPLSYLLESAGGSDLEQALESNLKKSIARKFDASAWTTLKGAPTAFDFDTKTVKDLLEQIVLSGGEYFSEPSNCALLVDPKAYAWLVKQDAVFTVQNFGDTATVKSGAVGKVFGMDVYMIPVTETYETVIAVNKDYIASGQFGDITYIKMVDSTGTTYIIAKALLAFGKATTGGVVSLQDNA